MWSTELLNEITRRERIEPAKAKSIEEIIFNRIILYLRDHDSAVSRYTREVGLSINATAQVLWSSKLTMI